jgi:hypothetical protein
MIVCPGVERVNREQFQGTDQLAYNVKVESPADSVTECISKKLNENSWQPLKEDFWNPGPPSSQVKGWTHFTDATVHLEATVDAWAPNGRIKLATLLGTTCNTGTRSKTGTLFLFRSYAPA